MRQRYGIRLDKQYFNFGSAHFLIFADGSREELHGHNYRATLELDADLDPGHVVADFIVVKPIFKQCCDALDHRTLLPLLHPRLAVEAGEHQVHARFTHPDGAVDDYVIPRRDVCLLHIANTSSELLARWLADQVLDRLRDRLPALRLHRVQVSVQESPGQSAIHERFFDA
ncbi:MAG: 6-carboxytetrahydropterin synthase [Deltaproteobacteria bacterium]|nr:6-carboxytetrahydropterin synthase [Deltaproteobacteria bacterium]